VIVVLAWVLWHLSAPWWVWTAYGVVLFCQVFAYNESLDGR
jgi:hypothetical protein